jgi:hypothetical protein
MEKTFASGVFHVLCYDKDGNLKWEEKNHNLVVSAGAQYMAGTALDGATARITTWYIGLVGGIATNTTFAAADTMASHAGWFEFTGYSQGARVTPSFTAATLASPSIVTNATAAAFTVSSAFASTGSSIATTTLTIGTLTSGAILPGQIITGTGVTAGTYIVANIAGSGSGSTWTVSSSQTVTSTAISSTSSTVAGAFLTSVSTKGGTTGTLFSGSDFTTGDRTVVSADTLNVTYTFTLTPS